MKKLNKNEYAPFFQPYIQVLLDNNKGLIENLKDSFCQAEKLLKNIDSEKQMYRYAQGKWTIKEIVQHLIDTERIFNYRALRISRNDSIDLVGFDQDQFVMYSEANERDFKNLMEEFSTLRKTTTYLYQSFSEKKLLQKGKVSSDIMSVRALGYLTSGHLLHHLNIINSRYL